MVEASLKELQIRGLIPTSVSIQNPLRPDITVIDSSGKVCCFIEVEYSHRRNNWDIIRPLGIPALEIFAEESFQMKSKVFYNVQPCELCTERDLQAARDRELQSLQAARDRELQSMQEVRDKERKRQK